MKRHHQTLFGEKVGNCFATCIACLLDLDVDAVPNFCASPSRWWDDARRWLGDRGITPVMIEPPDGLDLDEFLPETLFIASGRSPRGDYMHSVIYRGGSLLHDPHPSGDGLLGHPQDVIFLVPTDPAAALAAPRGGA